MKVFHCNNCRQLVFFESSQCVHCGYRLAFLPDLKIVGSLEPEERAWIFRASGKVHSYRLCANYADHNICNWAIPAGDSNPLCVSCRLTRVVPDLNQDGFREAWFKLEIAKRRLVYTLMELNCFVKSKAEDPRGVSYELLADPATPDAAPVLSGHNDGVITINIAEADDAERERRRLQLHEPYRTLLGHFRHESGHYYWNMLINESSSLDTFRNVFGDERQAYGEAIQGYYKNGPRSDWQQQFITSYASSHPWEDWAETWAHYLHMIDALETAEACGLLLRPPRADEPALQAYGRAMDAAPFENLIDRWYSLTYVLNNLNRGMGLMDAYPFVLSNPAVEKLRFVHQALHPICAEKQSA